MAPTLIHNRNSQLTEKTGELPQFSEKEQLQKANILLNDEEIEAFPLRSETREGCPTYYCFSTLYWKSYLKWQDEKGAKCIQIEKEE